MPRREDLDALEALTTRAEQLVDHMENQLAAAERWREIPTGTGERNV